MREGPVRQVPATPGPGGTMSTSKTDWPVDSPVRKRRLDLRDGQQVTRLFLGFLVLAVIVFGGLALAHRAPRAPRGVPVVVQTFYAERNGPTATGRICSRTVVTVP